MILFWFYFLFNSIFFSFYASHPVCGPWDLSGFSPILFICCSLPHCPVVAFSIAFSHSLWSVSLGPRASHYSTTSTLHSVLCAIVVIHFTFTYVINTYFIVIFAFNSYHLEQIKIKKNDFTLPSFIYDALLTFIIFFLPKELPLTFMAG